MALLDFNTRSGGAARPLARAAVAAVTASSPKFGCLMAMLPSLDADAPAWAAHNVPASELAADGVETEPHVTILYGFGLGFDSGRLAQVLARRLPPVLTLGAVSRFECDDYDVLKVDVDSVDLENLHKLLAGRFAADVTPSKWPYRPHLTLAYVQKGACRHLDGDRVFDGRSVAVTQALYSLPDKQGRRVFDFASLPDGPGLVRSSRGRLYPPATLKGVGTGETAEGGDILRAVREEKLARRLARVMANTPVGHEFRGNQWTEHALDPANDPAGDPSGKVRHAVLVIGGKRYKGPSHFQAFLAWANSSTGEVSPESAKLIQREGFQTESGHFLDRRQAALYVGHRQTSLTSEEATDDHGLSLTAKDGLLYTFDRVQAASSRPGRESAPSAVAPGNPVPRGVALTAYEAFDAVRRSVEDEVGRAVRKVVAVAEAEASKPTRRQEDDDYLGGYAADTFHAALASAYSQAATGLSANLGLAYPLSPGEADQYAQSRADLLKGFPERLAARLRVEALHSKVSGDRPGTTAAKLAAEGDKVAETEGRLVAEVEAQVACGTGQLRALRLAGYATAQWVTVGDDRVRETHTACEAQGEVPLGSKFSNGLRYPGDPSGPLSEVANCRCWLEGGRRAS